MSQPPQSAPTGSPSRPHRSSRWNRRSRVMPLGFSLNNRNSTLPRREVDFGVCMIDDEWALLVHTKNDFDQLAPVVPVSPLGTMDVNVSPSDSRQSSGTFNAEALNALEGKRDFSSNNLQQTADMSRETLHNLQNIPTAVTIPERRSSIDGARQPMAHLRPPPGRPVSVIHPPPTQAPVSCLRRQSLPPQLDGTRPTSIKFADEAPSQEAALAQRAATVASLNETLRLRKSYATLQTQHAHLYDAALDARNEIARLRGQLDHAHEVMESLINWGLAMQTENEILREQIPNGGVAMGPIRVKSAGELRALFDINFGRC